MSESKEILAQDAGSDKFLLRDTIEGALVRCDEVVSKTANTMGSEVRKEPPIVRGPGEVQAVRELDVNTGEWRRPTRTGPATLGYKECIIVDEAGFILVRKVSPADTADPDEALSLLDRLSFCSRKVWAGLTAIGRRAFAKPCGCGGNIDASRYLSATVAAAHANSDSLSSAVENRYASRYDALRLTVNFIRGDNPAEKLAKIRVGEYEEDRYRWRLSWSHLSLLVLGATLPSDIPSSFAPVLP